MARFMGGDFSEERAEVEVLDDGEERVRAIGREIYQEYIKLDRADPMYPRGISDYVGLGGGYRFPEPDQPWRFRIVKLPGDLLPEIMHSRIGSLYSRKVIDAIEAIEPEVHQYLAAEVLMPDGQLAPQRYWLINNMNRLDALVLEKSERFYEKWPNKEKWPNFSRYDEILGFKPVLALDKAKIAGKAKWTDYKLMLGFASEEFAAFLDANGIKGWEASDFFTQRTTVIEV